VTASWKDLCHSFQIRKSHDRAVKVLRRCVLRLWDVRKRGQNRTAKFALIDPITRLFRRLIRFCKFIFGGADERDSTKHVQLVKRGDIFDSLAFWPRVSDQLQSPNPSPSIFWLAIHSEHQETVMKNYVPAYRDHALSRWHISKSSIILMTTKASIWSKKFANKNLCQR